MFYRRSDSVSCTVGLNLNRDGDKVRRGQWGGPSCLGCRGRRIGSWVLLRVWALLFFTADSLVHHKSQVNHVTCISSSMRHCAVENRSTHAPPWLKIGVSTLVLVRSRIRHHRYGWMNRPSLQHPHSDQSFPTCAPESKKSIAFLLPCHGPYHLCARCTTKESFGSSM